MRWTTGMLCVLATLATQYRPARAEPPAVYADPGQPLERRVDDILGRLSPAERIALLSTSAPAIDRLHIPAFNGFNQSLHGVVWTRPTTMFPAPVAMAATWDPPLVHDAASAIADEARAIDNLWPTIAGKDVPSLLGMRVTVTPSGAVYGHNGLLYRAPVINLARDPRWGRIWEGFGEDPWLSARMTVAYVQGMQGDDPRYMKIAATLKHFPLNDEERDRSSSNVDVGERMLHEYYLRPFQAGVREAGVASVMSSYNAIDGTPAAENTRFLTDILRDAWGFGGIAVPDSGAVENIVRKFHADADMAHAVARSIGAGTDLDTGSFTVYAPDAMRQGLLSQQQVDQAVRRILGVRFRLGEFDPPDRVPYTKIPPSVIDSAEHRRIALQVARESIVLLRNDGNLLPLDRTKLGTLAVIGPMADTIVKGAQYTGLYSSFPTNLDGIRKKLGPAVQVLYARGSGVSETDDPQASLKQAEAVARKADAAILFVGTNDTIERETLDRTVLTLPPVQGELIRRVRAANPRTVLVLQNGGPVSLAPTQIEYLTGYIFPGEKSAEAPAMLDMFWAGEEGAAAIADIVFGDADPAGRLPYTVYRSDANLVPMNDRDISKGATYLYYGGTPEYAFGHGLSYTSFAYAKPTISAGQLPQGPVQVTADVTNTGKRDGDEVVQVYVHDRGAGPKRPKLQLVAFRRVSLKAGETRTLAFSIAARDLAAWDDAGHGWTLAEGPFDVMIGSSSRDIRLTGQFRSPAPGRWADRDNARPH